MSNTFKSSYKSNTFLLVYSKANFEAILKEIYNVDKVSLTIFADGIDIKTDSYGNKNYHMLKLKLAKYLGVSEVVDIIGYTNRFNPTEPEIWVSYLF